MKKYLLFAIPLFVIPSLLAQSDTAGTVVTGDPSALLASAAPYYDYQSAEMKPWHIRYHYQAFDDKGAVSVEGEFDYWWSPKVSRASWTHGDQAHIEWHTADGKELHAVTGGDIGSLQHRLASELLPGFLRMADAKSGGGKLKYFKTMYSSMNLECVGFIRAPNSTTQVDSLDSVWPAYCFKEHDPVLIASHENGTIVTVYGQPQKFQNHNFPGEIEISYAGQKRVDAKLEDVSEVHADAPAFAPSIDAKEYVQKTTTITVPVFHMNSLVPTTRVRPIYPPGFRGTGIGGTVVIAATIGKDGRIKNASVVSSPNTAFGDAALDAVRQWLYKPLMVNGEPTEVHTTINLTFAP